MKKLICINDSGYNTAFALLAGTTELGSETHHFNCGTAIAVLA